MRTAVIFAFQTLICILLSFFSSCTNNISPIISEPQGYAFVDIEPSWSPDGNKIIYVHNDSIFNKSGLYIIDTNGSNNKMLLNGIQSNPNWSPNGEWIAFSEDGQIFKVKRNGDSLTQLTESGSNFTPTWSSDGNWIYYDSNFDGRYYIWKMYSNGTEKSKIIYNDTINIGVRAPFLINNKIVHLGYFKESTGEPQICVMNNDGSNYQKITNNKMLKNLPKLSSDEHTIVFYIQESGPVFQVWTVNVDGTNFIKLTDKQGYSPSWSPNCQLIVFTNSNPNNGMLWIMNKDGSNKHQLTY